MHFLSHVLSNYCMQTYMGKQFDSRSLGGRFYQHLGFPECKMEAEKLSTSWWEGGWTGTQVGLS